VLHVRAGERRAETHWLEDLDRLVRELGGTVEAVQSDDPVDGVLAYAYQQHVTQIVVGEPQRTRWQQLIRGSFVNDLIRKATNIDIHVIARRVR
jgi:two-component system sensor histidine kinase KdpD